jgi:acetyl-CoA carboxylase biotin carboxylase subunit
MMGTVRKLQKVLIANRGEIALRIQRACRGLGIRTVQAYSEADASASYVALADEAVCIGAPHSSKSYLNSGMIVMAAKATGADAIHPGYGFLSENADFAELAEQNGVVFVGAPSSAIRIMGDKISAKRAMLEVGVPCIPGSPGALPDDVTECAAICEKVGYPLIVKASGGGGGRGMRVVHSPDGLAVAVSTTREEARKAFSNPDLYAERFLTEPRHVEIQVVVDREGNGVWLGERDCSMQRRHQKVLEEAPAPNIDRVHLAEVAQRCLEACKAIGYQGVGTFEFLYERGQLFFIEMNTRLQVEHPVTEAVTDIDIVMAQLRIAAGEKLWLAQEDVIFQGHAIECRINAEDPDTYSPASGTVTEWSVPAGLGIRLDSHALPGSKIPPFYDSMLGKLIVYARTRELAIDRMRAALDELRIGGIKTNIPLHHRILADEGFRSGRFDIHHLEKMNSTEHSAGR